jgi:hypothetical protein
MSEWQRTELTVTMFTKRGLWRFLSKGKDISCYAVRCYIFCLPLTQILVMATDRKLHKLWAEKFFELLWAFQSYNGAGKGSVNKNSKNLHNQYLTITAASNYFTVHGWLIVVNASYIKESLSLYQTAKCQTRRWRIYAVFLMIRILSSNTSTSYFYRLTPMVSAEYVCK